MSNIEWRPIQLIGEDVVRAHIVEVAGLNAEVAFNHLDIYPHYISGETERIGPAVELLTTAASGLILMENGLYDQVTNVSAMHYESRDDPERSGWALFGSFRSGLDRSVRESINMMNRYAITLSGLEMPMPPDLVG